ncbi:MAG: hypothetical protein LC104_01255 [Bacteroidales bacterium]|nr:hypothetical protein [Bacteroidales bacterium]
MKICIRFSLVPVCLVLLLIGCGEDGPKMKPVFPVHGTVKVKGQPAAGVQLNFSPIGAGKDATFATATSSGDGAFELSTYKKGDGAPAAEYIITAFWPDHRPGTTKVRAAAGEEIAPDRLSGVYSNPATSKLRATVREQDNTLTIDIP